MGALIVIFVGLIVSKLTPQHNKELREEYFSPVIRRFINKSKHHTEYYSLQQQNTLKQFQEKL